MSSSHYLEFLGTVWNQLPSEDRDRFAELWAGYEQVFAAVYQKFAEVNLNSSIEDLQAYSTERWLPYSFNSTNAINRPATVTSNQDISLGVSTAAHYLLKFRVDGTTTFEVNIQGVDNQARIAFIVSKINEAAGFRFARAIFDNTIVQLSSPTSGVSSSIEILPTSIPEANACEVILGVDADSLPAVYPEFRYPYKLPYDSVVSIPELRNGIRDDSVTETLREGDDYLIERAAGVIVFAEPPTEEFWASRTLIDTETPWHNFGFLTGVYQTNTADYVSIVQSLWYALWNGSKPINIKRSLYLLFGIPAAREDSTVTAVSASSIETTTDDGTVHTFEIPSGLEPVVSVGDRVERFDPLVSGIEVFDKINRPGFIVEDAGREGLSRFLTQDATTGEGNTDETKALTLLEEHTFIPQFSVDAFISQGIDLRNVKIFLDAIKPLHKSYLLQVILGAFRDRLGFTDNLKYTSRLDVTANLDSNPTSSLDEESLLEYETTDNESLGLDTHGILFGDRVEFEVYKGGMLVDSFSI